MECLFCKIIRSEVPSLRVWENESALAFLDINPIKPGHVLLVPKEHSEDVFEMDETQFAELMISAKKLVPHLKGALSSRRVGMVVEGFGVPHTHIHLVPVNSGNELNPELAKAMSAVELENIQTLLLGAFKEVK